MEESKRPMEYPNRTDDLSAPITEIEQAADPSIYQLQLLDQHPPRRRDIPYRTALVGLLNEDLSFHSADTSYASHDFHSFPAKFPPQLPEKFILGLTDPGDLILDPMMGSGTTILEAILRERRAVGFDIDPLARLITTVKTTPLEPEDVHQKGQDIIENATKDVQNCSKRIEQALAVKWDSSTQKFVDYWFARETQIELQALAEQIQQVENGAIRAFFELAFSVFQFRGNLTNSKVNTALYIHWICT